MKTILLSVTILWILIAAVAESPASGDELGWHPFGEALAKAKAEKKHVYVYIYTNSCGWCKKFWSQTLTSNDIEAELDESFIVTKINMSSSQKVELNGDMVAERQIGAMFAVRGYPHSVFMNGDNEVIAKIPGYLSPDKFSPVLKFIGGGWYKDMNFQEFQQSENELEK